MCGSEVNDVNILIMKSMANIFKLIDTDLPHLTSIKNTDGGSLDQLHNVTLESSTIFAF